MADQFNSSVNDEEYSTNTEFINTLNKILRSYKDVPIGEGIDSSREVFSLVKNQAPALLEDIVIRKTSYKKQQISTQGSVGNGNWASVPWISIQSKNGRNLKYGTNPVILFDSKDEKLYLTLNQQVKRNSGNGNKTNKELKETGEELKDKYSLKGFEDGPLEIDVGGIGKKYGPATVFYKEYSLDSIDGEVLEKDIARITELFFENLDENDTSYITEENKNTLNEDRSIFLAPCSNSAAYAHLRDTVIRRVPTETVNQYSTSEFDHDVVSVWGNREGTEGSWKKIDAGDFLLFYKEGSYIYAAEIIDTEINNSLSKKLWPDDDGDPWEYIIYLKEPFKIEVSQDEINDLAGYSENNICQGFQSLREEGVEGIKQKYGSVKDFLQQKYISSASLETEFMDGEYNISSSRKVINEDHPNPDPYSDVDIEKKLHTDLSSSLLDDQNLYFPDKQDKDIIEQVQAALNSGKNIIFTGPPGTGKTEIAEAVVEELGENTDYFTGHQLTTATADWSTFDTVGGFMPEKDGDGDLEFNAGQILKRFKDDERQLKNEALVIDEINRSDIDKAFGQLFTVLSGQKVQLPYTADNGKEIEVIPGKHDDATETPEKNQFIVPESWRILATMNSYDKTSLYEMSYAFMRRFAFIRVDAPDENLEDHLEEYNNHWKHDVNPEEKEAVADIWQKTNSAVQGRKIGPAIAEDILGYLAEGKGEVDPRATNAVINYIFPQLEGVRKNNQIVKEIADSNSVNGEKLKNVAKDMLQVKFNEDE